MPAVVRPREQGQALIFVVVLLALGIGVFVYSTANPTAVQNERAAITATTLAQVKQALIGYAVRRGDIAGDPRPGEFPCPDTDNDGFEQGSCSAGRLGRVPWKTLGIPEPKDDAGETLWYAVAGPFRTWNSNGNPLNSDTKGNITVYSGTSATIVTSEAVAVIFAPGAALGSQVRNPAVSAFCPTTSSTIATDRCAANYLESAAGVNNAVNNGPFLSAPASDSFNDRLALITTQDFIPLVEQRVARELRGVLQSYKANSLCNCYPWADASDGKSNVGLNRGRVPWDQAAPEDWGDGSIPKLPSWFGNNDWARLIYYAVAQTSLAAGGLACTSCIDPTLSVDGAPGAELVILTPGPAGAGRPLAYPFSNWAAYFEDSENSDNSNDRYVTPSSTAFARDRLFRVP